MTERNTETNKKLRIGLLMDSFDVQSWVYALLEKVLDTPYCKVELVVLNDHVEQKKNIFIRAIAHFNTLLYAAYFKLESKLVRVDPDAFEWKNSAALLKGIPLIKIKPRQTKYSDWIEPEDLGKIQACRIDVFVRLGFRILRGDILKAARFGVWSYHHGDQTVNRGGPAGFWETFENRSVTGAVLQILTEDLDNGIVIHRSYSATDRSFANRNRHHYFWKTVSFLPKKLEELYRLGDKAFFEGVSKQNEHPLFYSGRLHTLPGNLEMARLLIQHFLRSAGRRLSTLFYFEQWQLMFDLRKGLSTSLWRFKKLIPPKDRFWADPFIVHKDNKYHIFMEDSPLKKEKGCISLIVMDENGRSEKPVKVLERPYHLSYPFLFEWQGEYYMIPETTKNKTIEVYKSVRFPFEWQFHRILMENIIAFDTTLLEHQNKWWLFANVVEHIGPPWDELCLFFSDEPLGRHWTSHPKNPIVSDVRRARPAGRIFKYQGRMYRPSQDCSKRYGYGIRINHIAKLDDKEYEEREVSCIQPGWDKKIKGIHTLNHVNELTVVDILTKRPRFF